MLSHFFSGYVQYLTTDHPDVLEKGLFSNQEYVKHLCSEMKVSTQPIEINEHDAAPLFIGKCNLSQRAYKNLKRILKEQNVNLPSYDNVRLYLNDLSVGNLHREPNHNSCMCVRAEVHDTLQLFIDSALFSHCSFKTVEEQRTIFDYLRRKTLHYIQI